MLWFRTKSDWASQRRLALAALLSLGLGITQAQVLTPAGPADTHFCEPAAAPLPGQAGPATPRMSSAQGPAQADGAATPAVEKVRKISRTFPTNPTKLYTLDTRYGRVEVNVWNRPEIRTDVTIITRADTDAKAQELQAMIEVELLARDPKTGGVSARSRFGELPRECRSQVKLYEVNYTVWVPANNPLALHNAFGEINLTADLTGATELAVEYGRLRTARLEGPRNSLKLTNARAAVPFARRAVIDASYAKVRLTEGGSVELRSNYSDIDIGLVGDLTVHSKYGDVALGTVQNLRGTSGYSRFSVDKLNSALDMKVQYSPSFEVRNTGPNFRQITLDGGYSTILLNFPDEAAFGFDVNTEHGQLLVDKRLVKVASEETSPTSSDTQGTFGATTARNAGNVNIKVRYGNVSFNK
ncbi:DUF4097 domain-containing protein [Hymenobacter psychrophilus]|uniref:Adhesin domain-containing protein n=1 Tax=Hymenobacter psychrophilus TaxID=651662 RepID=A0A1H3KKW9_9BACT|nr:DUF4097 domain-containing protein [Hymenobacter psychrophilus]SDY52811.1 hypothetical protein SAMN04488069_109176 [Hymenobacter psychrophilus]